MTTSKFLVPLYDVSNSMKTFTGHAVVDAEGCAGLYIHRTHHDVTFGTSPWRVTTVTGYRAYVGRLNTRREARSVAHRVAAMLPPQVLSGEWTGANWLTHDPESAETFKREVYGADHYSI